MGSDLKPIPASGSTILLAGLSLVVAVAVWLAESVVADYLGRSYNHDGIGPTRRVKPQFHSDADAFLRSQWAVWLGDQIGVKASAIFAQAERLDAEDRQVSDRAA